jgi:hypothetical protein
VLARPEYTKVVTGAITRLSLLLSALWAIAWKEWAMITLVSLVAVLTNLAIPVTFSWLILFIGDEVCYHIPPCLM